jgi:hypothetical protein
MPEQPFTTIGQKTDEVVVSISYRIIELFSGGLYSSPNKAVEELVANAYDALASDVRLLVPANVSAEDATIWVIDDGESMDVADLHELWQTRVLWMRSASLRSRLRTTASDDNTLSPRPGLMCRNGQAVESLDR